MFNAVEAMDGDGTVTVTTANRYIEQSVAENNYLKRGEYVLLSVSESLGYSVRIAASGEEAVDLIAEKSFDLVLLDMLMDPGMNGRRCYELMLDHRPGIKAIIASGFSESEEVKKALSLGAASFIRKPYTMVQPGRELRQALGGRSAG